MSVPDTFRFIMRHPLSRNHRFEALLRWFRWQIGSRIVPGPVAADFVNNSVLLVGPGMTGATGNIYSGLHEFEEMAFLLHMLREGDLFVDVGANIGSYTVLAAGAVGSECISIEPVEATFKHLMRNVWINNIGGIVDARNLGAGPEDGVLSFITGKDTMNHVATEHDKEDACVIKVRADMLDNVVGDRHPRLIKIDVEGFESGVIAGAQNVLSRDTLAGVIMELNGNGLRYGFDDADVHLRMLDFGFRPFAYQPFERNLSLLDGKNRNAGNTIYIRDKGFVLERLAKAQPFRVIGKEI